MEEFLRLPSVETFVLDDVVATLAWDEPGCATVAAVAAVAAVAVAVAVAVAAVAAVAGTIRSARMIFVAFKTSM